MSKIGEINKDNYFRNAKIILGTIAILNTLIIFMQGKDITTLLVQSFFGIMLYRGAKWARYLFMIGLFLSFFFIIYLKLFIMQNQIVSLYSNNIYFFISLGFVVITFLLLSFSKSVKYYVENK